MNGRIDQRLQEAIEGARRTCEQFVIVEVLPYFVQLMPNFGAIYGEVVSNTYLDPSQHLTEQQEIRLEDLGWLAPGVSCHPECRRTDHPNFTRLWPPTATSRRVAHDLLEGLMAAAAPLGEGGPDPVLKVGRRVTRATIGRVPGH
jgi:hypothetical protein